MGEQLITDIEGHCIVWSFRGGDLHLCEGAATHPGITLLWTRCGKHDIPAGAAWLQRRDDVLTCEACCDVEDRERVRPTPPDAGETEGSGT